MKSKTVESFFEPFQKRREDCFSTLEQIYPGFEEIMRTQAIIAEKKLTKLKELTMLYLKSYVLLLTDIFQKKL